MNRPFYFLTLVVFFATACAHQHEPDAQLDMSGDQSHGSEEGQSFTVYSSQIEVFAELDAAKENQAIEINGHFTLLQEGHEPLTGAKVSLQLTEDGNFVQEAVGEPVIPGIYRFVLEPGPGVHGKLHFIISSSWIQDTVVVDHFHPGGDHGHYYE